MPFYQFECLNCGWALQVSRPMSESGDPTFCSVCNERMIRDFHAEHSSIRGDYKEPIVSDSLAFDAIDLAEHKKRFPGVDVEVDGDGRTARPILRSLSQKRQYLRGRNWVDQN